MAPPLPSLSVSTSVSGARLPTVSARPVLQAPARSSRIATPASALPQAGSVGQCSRLDTRASAEPEERVVTCQPLAYQQQELEEVQEVTTQDIAFATQTNTAEPSTCSFALCKDQNSVTIKSNTNVKDSAGAIMKVLERLSSTMVVALQQEPSHEALNRAVKALAVCRKYLKDTYADLELSFFPVYRSNMWGQPDPNLFSFITFKSVLQTPQPSTPSEQDSHQDDKDTNLHASSNSDTAALAAAIVRTVVEKGQAVLKAGGGCALFVAMTAVMHARQQLKSMHLMDIALVPQWITEDTRASLGRESKFLEFRILPSGMCNVMPGMEGAARQPAIRAITAMA